MYEREFAIGVRLNVAAGMAPGEINVPARLRYQACDDKLCYIPATATTGWTLRVLPGGAQATARNAELFAGIPFGTGEAPPAMLAPAEADVPRRGSRPAIAIAQLDDFTVLGTHRRLPGHATIS